VVPDNLAECGGAYFPVVSPPDNAAGAQVAFIITKVNDPANPLTLDEFDAHFNDLFDYDNMKNFLANIASNGPARLISYTEPMVRTVVGMTVRPDVDRRAEIEIRVVRPALPQGGKITYFTWNSVAGCPT
jgi:hypothetical protein